MTDEERQKLCAKLRRFSSIGEWYAAICEEAANEIERLAKERDYWHAFATEAAKEADHYKALAKNQADEIERLAKENKRLEVMLKQAWQCVGSPRND
jgi:hypothetical protein